MENEKIIEELENIREELLSHTNGSNIFGYVYVKDINKVFDVFISELKEQ